MTVGILKEDAVIERRVALTPAGVQTLVSAGHQVYVQHEAGERLENDLNRITTIMRTVESELSGVCDATDRQSTFKIGVNHCL